MITREEERELIRRFQEEGDEAARDALVEAHMRYLNKLARRMSMDRSNVEQDDLVQVGAMHLMKALPAFDLSLGTKLLTFCTRGILQDMRDACTTDRVVRVPANSFSPSAPEGVQANAARAAKTASLNAKVGGADSDKELIATVFTDYATPDQIAAESEVITLQLARLTAAMERLSPNERIVIKKVREGLGQQEIADLVGVSKARIDQVLDKAVSKLRALVSVRSHRPANWREKMKERCRAKR